MNGVLTLMSIQKSLATRQDVALVLQAVRDVHHLRVESSLPQRSPDPFPEPQLFKHRPAEVVELQVSTAQL